MRSGERLGERLDDRFELEAQIASGGMGEVFRARDPDSGAVVAVKILPDQRGAASERFAREIADPSHRTSFLEQVPESARTLALASAWLGASDAGGGGSPP